MGLTAAPDFPVVNPIQLTYGGQFDAFVLKLSASGTSALFVTYLGGTSSDYGQAAATDADGAAYATGWTGSSDFPTANSFQSQYAGNADVFISKITDTISGGTPSATPNPASPTGTSTSTPPAATPTTTATPTAPPAATSTLFPAATATIIAGTATATRTRTATATQAVPSPIPTNPPTVSPTPCTITFSDVPVGSTFYGYVRCLTCLGIVNGYPDGTFRPGNNVTRGQFAKIVANSGGFHDPPVGQTFEDVPPGSTFYTYTERLATRGVMSGYPCGSPGEPCVPPGNRPYFRPNNNATRGQISKMVSNAAGFFEPAGAQQFEDVPPSHTFYPYIWRLASRGVMQGYPCGAGEPCMQTGGRPYFRPNYNATRGQTSKIVANTFYPNCNRPARRW